MSADRAIIRPARDVDLAHLQAIEDAADALLTDALRPDSWQPAPDGRSRAVEPGFVLVALGPGGREPIGFAHVIERDEIAHLEQLSVLPGHARHGSGRALVEAAKAESRIRGHRRLTLRTYADLPWNAPFYRSCGFVESTPDTAFLKGLVAAEQGFGLDRHGRRVQMTAELVDP